LTTLSCSSLQSRHVFNNPDQEEHFSSQDGNENYDEHDDFLQLIADAGEESDLDLFDDTLDYYPFTSKRSS
jgi:hypothetical protein